MSRQRREYLGVWLSNRELPHHPVHIQQQERHEGPDVKLGFLAIASPSQAVPLFRFAKVRLNGLAFLFC